MVEEKKYITYAAKMVKSSYLMCHEKSNGYMPVVECRECVCVCV